MKLYNNYYFTPEYPEMESVSLTQYTKPLHSVAGGVTYRYRVLSGALRIVMGCCRGHYVSLRGVVGGITYRYGVLSGTLRIVTGCCRGRYVSLRGVVGGIMYRYGEYSTGT